MTEFERLVLLLGCKATLILGIVAALYLLAGRRWPQSCTTWLRLGIVALWALPVGVWALPTIGIPILSVPRAATAGGEASLAGKVASGQLAVGQNLSAGQRDKLPATVSSLPAAAAAEPGWYGWSPVRIVGLCLAAAYGLVVVVLAIRFVGAWRGLNQLRRASALVRDPAWQETLAHWSRVLQVRRPVELRASDNVSVPMTFGWRVPVILVPGDCITPCEKNQGDNTQREAILIHELTHIARSDFFWQALTQVTALLYWMHPLVWLIRRQDGALRERICDAFCSQYLSREVYARALVQIAGRKHFRPAAALGMAMAHPSSLQRRLHDLHDATAAQSSIPNQMQRAFLGGTAVLVLGLIVVGTLTAKPPAARKAPAKKKEVAPVRLPETLEGQVVDEENRPIAKASVTVLIRRFNPYLEPTDSAAPKPWTATTDDRGRYTISTGELMLGPDDEIRIKVRAEGFADSSQMDYDPRGVQGKLPIRRLHVGRKVHGQIVDPEGNPVGAAIIRFHAETEDMKVMWDAGPLPVDKPGAFSFSIPKAGKAGFIVYTRDFAPRIFDIPEGEADLGEIRVESGTSLTGRVVDRQGQGVAGTVVGILSEVRLGRMIGLPIGTAVKTDETGRFTLPPVRGIYTVRVTDGAPDYSRQLYETGAKPPPILPERIDFDGIDKTQEIEFREAVSVTVRGTVRLADGSGAPDVEMRAFMLPASWVSSVDLDSARTDAEGNYTLRLPAPVERAYISVWAAGNYHQAIAVGNGANAGDKNRTVRFDLLTEDVEEVDWEVEGRE